MRESNFSNPAQNKACVCISAAVYDRRAIDCTATLPLINSLNHLAYLTSTSPRIREMVTMDGGLERLVRILRTIPKTPGPNARTISIKEMQAIWKWSLAFQCVVNIGVRGSEHVRTRVVEAGMVPVTIRVLESYLRSVELAKEERRREAHETSRREERSARSAHETEARSAPMTHRAHLAIAVAAAAAAAAATNPTAHATGMLPTTTTATTATNSTSRQRATSSSTARQAPALPSSVGPDVDVDITEVAPQTTAPTEALQLVSQGPSRAGGEGRLRQLVSETRPTTPLEGGTASTVLVGMESRSSSDGFLDAQTSNLAGANSGRSPLPIIDALDAMPLAPTDVDLDTGHMNAPASPSASSSSELPSTSAGPAGEGDGPTFAGRGHSNSGVLTNVSSAEDLGGHGGEASGSGSEGAEDADMFADDADDSEFDASAASARPSDDMAAEEAEDRRTPRPTRRSLAPLADQEASPVFSSAFNTPAQTATAAAMASELTLRQEDGTSRVRTQTLRQSEFQQPLADTVAHAARSRNRDAPAAAAPTRAAQTTAHVSSAASTTVDMVYREEEVLLSLQLLAYLSKYAHVRTLFHSSDLANTKFVGPLNVLNESLSTSADTSRSWDPAEAPKRNVFSVAERFTLRSSRSGSSHPPPRLAMEIQYWAGVIMRNACRKDESRGGIRQCANMLCGKWEAFPREFAKCRRCRKAKYCSKQCQSKGWQMGHRFWCSSRSDDGDARERDRERANQIQAVDGRAPPTVVAAGAVGTRPGEIGFVAGQNMDEDLGDVGQRLGQAAEGHHAHHHHPQPQTHPHHHHHHHAQTTQHQTQAQAQTQTMHQPVAQVHHHSQPPAPQATAQTQAHWHTHQHARQHTHQHPNQAAGHGGVDVQTDQAAGPPLRSARAEGLVVQRQAPESQQPASGSQTTLAESQLRARGLPSTLAGGHLQDRRVSSLASVDTIDGSDFSDDELDRRMIETEGMHPAVAAAAVAAGGRNGAGHEVPLVTPQRTDLAGRPLPPPVIASQIADEDELALGGRATPGVGGDQDFGDGAFDQMLGHWDPSRAVGAIGLRHRLAEVRAEIPSPDRSSSPDAVAWQEAETRSEGHSEDELHAPRARYHALYGHQQPQYASVSRAHQPFSHRLQQQRSISGFATPTGSNTPMFGASGAGPSALHPSRAVMTPSPLSANPVRGYRNDDEGGVRMRSATPSTAAAGDAEMQERGDQGHVRAVSHTPMFSGLERRQRAASIDRMSSSLGDTDGDVAMDF